MSDRRAIVLGGGIAGLAAAIALDAAGYAVDVVERVQRFEPIGAALSLWPNAIAALDRLGVADRLAGTAAPITALALRDRDGRVLMGPIPVGRSLLPTRAALQDCLLTGPSRRTRLHFGQSCKAIEDESGRPVAVLADGTSLIADLIIDASGIGSAVADRVIGNAARDAGYGGVLAISERHADGDDPTGAEYWGERERFGLFDVGQGRRYWFFMRNAAPGALPPDHAACRAVAESWSPEIAAAIMATKPDRLIPFAIRARSTPRRLGRGRLICIGDAAHAMEPNLGQGGCLSLEDAVVLGTLARRLEPDEILPAFEHRRLSRIRKTMDQSAAAARPVHRVGPTDRLLRRLLPYIPDAISRRRIASVHRARLDV